jgi:glycosyltransferase involved in cell wall biosynthesis
MLEALYRRCQMVVFPTLFEGAGLPLLEAGRLGKAVACSNIPPFLEFAGDAPAYFDPRSPQSMASEIKLLWNDGARCDAIGCLLHEQTARLSWEKTAVAHLAIYRLVADEPLSEAERRHLSELRMIHA